MHRPLVRFLAGTGARFGEATALRLADFDRANSSARITRAWKYAGTGSRMELGPPKTARGRRTIAVPAAVFDELPAGARTTLAYRTATGLAMNNGRFHEQAWSRAVRSLEAATGVRPRVHDLRHSYASWAGPAEGRFAARAAASARAREHHDDGRPLWTSGAGGLRPTRCDVGRDPRDRAQAPAAPRRVVKNY